jgi:ATP-dependent Clp protease, protease subunit
MAIVGLNFHGPISHPATNKLRNALCAAINERIQNGTHAGKRQNETIFLFMNSGGGQLDDAASLFGLIRSSPVEIVTVNVGQIASCAILPFIAGSTRIALPHSKFHFHDYEWNYAGAHNLTRLEYLDHTKTLESFRETTFDILKENTSLTDNDLKELKLLEVPIIKNATFAKEKGIVHEVKYVTIPEGMNVFNVDY